nr:MAG TPA: hypothetical protein [Caudoviricetes sp.]
MWEVLESLGRLWNRTPVCAGPASLHGGGARGLFFGSEGASGVVRILVQEILIGAFRRVSNRCARIA